LALTSNSAQGKRNSKLKLGNYTMKAAIICTPISLLVMHTENQMWTQNDFISEIFFFMLKW